MALTVTDRHRASLPHLPWRWVLVAFLAFLHLMYGPQGMSPSTVWRVLGSYDPMDLPQRILVMIRLPRLLAVVLGGFGLGLAGYLVQTVLRNRLAEPHILGLNAGASLVMVLITAVPALQVPPMLAPLAASLGAGLLFAVVMIVATAGRRGPTPAKVIFCGIAFTALANALTAAILLLDESTLEELRFWLSGDASGVRMAQIVAALPVLMAGGGLALILSRGLGALCMGDAVARSLGGRSGRLRFGALVAAALMCGAAVAMIGPIGFVGLMAPMLCPRFLNRPGFAAVLTVGITGAGVLIASDLAATMLLNPRELPTGALTGLLGAPAFMWVLRGAVK